MRLNELLDKEDINPSDRIIISEAIKEFESLSKEIDSLKKQSQLNKKLLTSEAIYSLLNVSPETSMLIDQNGKILAINNIAAERLGSDPTSITGKCVFDFFEENVAKYRRAKCNQVFNSGEPIYFEDERKGRIFETYIYPVIDENSEVKELAIFSRDITEKRKMQAQLEESELKYRTLVERSKDGILIVQNGVIKYINQSLANIFGTPVEEILNRPFTNFLDPDSIEFVSKRYKERMAGKEVPSIYELTLITKNGEPVYSELNVGKIIYQSKPAIIISIRDIRERKIAEAKIKENEQMLRKIIDLVPHHIFAKDRNGKFLLVNNTVAKMYGTTVEEIEGKYHQEIHPNKDEITRFLAEDIKVIDLQQPYFIPEHKFTDSNGNISVLQTIKIPFQYGSTPAVLGVAIDITELKKKEEEIKRIKIEEERYQAMLNHFINNDLQKIVSNLEWLLYEYNNDKRFDQKTVEEMIDLAHHSSQTIEKVSKIFEILQTSFNSHHTLKVKLTTIINNVLKDLKEKYSTPLTIDWTDDSDSQILPCDVSIKDAFYEIFSFIAENTPKDTSQKIKIIKNQTENKLEVIIQDQYSTKIPEELSCQLSKRITDSWEWKGHYIGLTLAANIIQHYYGSLLIEPGIKKGNTFKISFPIPS
ncbi:MAG: PAS domain S-box protein [Candidatus Hodarchaeales archaeon]